MFTTSQQVANTRVNTTIFVGLALIGAICGVFIWHQLLPAALPEIPLWRVLWALATDPRQRAFWQQYSVITYLVTAIVCGALGLPLLIAAIRKTRNP